MYLKMQNKPKLKIAKIPITSFKQRTNKDGFWPPQPKNKPKQSQIPTTCHPERSEVLWVERSEIPGELSEVKGSI